MRSSSIPAKSTSTTDIEDEAPEIEDEVPDIGDDEGQTGDVAVDNEPTVPSWVSNAPVYVLWAGLAAYAFTGAPNQTPYRDQLFIEQLLLIRSIEDGLGINPLLVVVWFSMGLLPTIYSALLIPTGRSEKGGVPVWPFASLSFFVGVFALLPYFGLWNPPPPLVKKDELSRWPLVVLESKLFSGFVTLSAMGLAARAAFCDAEIWEDYFRLFRESRFIHVMTIDFVLLNLLVAFWIFNDVSMRSRSRNSWLMYLPLLPLVGPSFYLLLRPRLPRELLEENSSQVQET